MTTNQTRRDFIKQTVSLLTLLAGGSLMETGLQLPAAGKGSFKIGDWTGDDFTIGHRLRDGKLPKLPKSPERTVDFVIVGGGIAGLTSAYHLRSSNILLLDQYDQFGGHARGGSHNGIGYSYGAAYIALDEGAVGELLDELNLEPIKLTESKNTWYQNGEWLRGMSGNDGMRLFQDMKKLKEEFKHFWGTWDGVYSRQLADSDKLMQLDTIPLDGYLKGYDQGSLALMDSVLKSGVNGGMSSLSALAGLSTLEDIFAPTYVLPGGNPTFARELAKKVQKDNADCLKSGAFVWSIQLRENGASVTYGLRDGSLHMVDCRHVIVAIPHMVAVRVMKGLNDKAKATLFRFRYGSYLVANVLLKKRVFDGAYDNWLATPFEISDITVAETPYMMAGSYKENMGSVLTIYTPYDAGSPGRTLLFQGDKRKFAGSIMAELEKVIANLDGNIEEIVLTRWGHSMAVARPQYIKYLVELHGFENDAFSFAHSSAHGLPGIEAATAGGKFAAQRARKTRSTAEEERLHSISGVRTAWNSI